MIGNISTAISRKHLLRFEYAGYVRQAEPYTYGVDRKSQRSLVAYQTAGGSRSGEEEGWKTFHERDMQNVEVIDATFHTRKDYRRNDPAFASIIAQL